MNRYTIGKLALAMMPGLIAPSFATDLLTIYREAVVQDSTYAGAKAQYIGAQKKLPQARALLPNINVGGPAQGKALEQAVSSTRLQRESTRLGQEVGVRTVVDGLNAGQQLREEAI